jgi:protein-tyrosine phosphatase
MVMKRYNFWYYQLEEADMQSDARCAIRTCNLLQKALETLKALSKQMTIRVVFVCSGNIMRSPYAEMLFEKYLEERQHSERTIISESLAVTYRNSSILDQTQDLLLENGVAPERIAQFSPRHIRDHLEVCQKADLIFGMTADHLAALYDWQEKTFLLSKFVSGPESEEIPDPFFSEDAWKAYSMVKEKVKGLVDLFEAASLLDSHSK